MKKGFEAGNEFRFGKENQPKKNLTSKQQASQIESMLAMPIEEVQKIASDRSSPAVLYNCANYILNGEERRVIELIAEYRKANGYRRVYESCSDAEKYELNMRNDGVK